MQGSGDAEAAGAGERGDVRGQRDLVGDALAELARVQPTLGDLGGLDLDLGAGERDHRGVLGRGECCSHAFQVGDPVDQRGAAVGGGIDSGVGEFGEAPEQSGQLVAGHSATLPARSNVMCER